MFFSRRKKKRGTVYYAMNQARFSLCCMFDFNHVYRGGCLRYMRHDRQSRIVSLKTNKWAGKYASINMTDPGYGFALKFLVQTPWNPSNEDFCVCLDLSLLLILVYSNSFSQQQSETSNLMLIELFGNWVSSFYRSLKSVNCTSSEILFYLLWPDFFCSVQIASSPKMAL